MKKTTISNNKDWKEVMKSSSAEILASLEEIVKFLQKNKKKINKEVKTFGGKASGVNELFEKLTIDLDTKRSEIWDIIDE